MKSLLKCAALMLTTILVLLQSCTYDKELIAPVTGCAHTLNVSFAAKVQPLLQANCFSCHANGASAGDVSLETYDGVKQAVVSGRLLGTVSHSPGFAPMPKGAAKLSDCSITAVRTWIQEGVQNN